RPALRRHMLAKYLLRKHYRGAPAAADDAPMDQWTPEELSAPAPYTQDFTARLERPGEVVYRQARSPGGTFLPHAGEGRTPLTDGPLAEAKDLIAGWMVTDVETSERAP